jgi:hypothetical protein
LFGVNRRKQKRKEKSHSLNNTTQHKLVAAEAERRRRRIIHQQQHSESQSQAMGFVGDTVDSIKSLQIRQVLHQGVSLGQFSLNSINSNKQKFVFTLSNFYFGATFIWVDSETIQFLSFRCKNLQFIIFCIFRVYVKNLYYNHSS